MRPHSSNDHAKRDRKSRNRAAKCRALAEIAKDEKLRSAYLAIAGAYETLAEREERIAESLLILPERTPASRRPRLPASLENKLRLDAGQADVVVLRQPFKDAHAHQLAPSGAGGKI